MGGVALLDQRVLEPGHLQLGCQEPEYCCSSGNFHKKGQASFNMDSLNMKYRGLCEQVFQEEDASIGGLQRPARASVGGGSVGEDASIGGM